MWCVVRGSARICTLTPHCGHAAREHTQWEREGLLIGQNFLEGSHFRTSCWRHWCNSAPQKCFIIKVEKPPDRTHRHAHIGWLIDSRFVTYLIQSCLPCEVDVDFGVPPKILKRALMCRYHQKLALQKMDWFYPTSKVSHFEMELPAQKIKALSKEFRLAQRRQFLWWALGLGSERGARQGSCQACEQTRQKH